MILFDIYLFEIFLCINCMYEIFKLTNQLLRYLPKDLTFLLSYYYMTIMFYIITFRTNVLNDNLNILSTEHQ